MKDFKIWLYVSLWSVFYAGSVNADVANASARGLEIAKEVDSRDKGWGDSTSNLRMVLKNKQGHTSERKMSLKNLEVAGDGDKSLTIFKQPKDVKGTAFLSFSHMLEADQQWLYLPALKRVKRIASANKSGPFLGSEFAFEDLSSFEVAKFDYEYLRDDSLNGQAVFVVKYIPKYKYSGYTSQETWIDKAEYRIQKVDFFDRKKALLKTLEYKGYKKYLNKYWRADQFIVTNHQTGKATVLHWDNYNFKTGLTEKDFNHSTLKRAR